MSGPGPGAAVRLPTATPAATWRALRRALRPRRRLALLAVPVMLADTVAGLIGPAVLGRIVDLATGGEAAAAITGPVLLLLVAGGAEGLLGVAGSMLVSRIGSGALADLRERVVERALAIPLGDLERAGTGDLLARVEGDVETVADVADDTLGDFLGDLLDIVLTIGGLALLDWRLALAGLAAVPVQLLALRWYLRRAPHLYAAAAVAEGERAQALLDAVGGAATIRAFRLSGRHLDRIARRSQAACDRNLASVTALSGFNSRLNVAELVGLATVLGVGFALVGDGAITVGAASAAALYFHRLFGPLNGVLGVMDDIAQAGAALSRLVGVAELPDVPPSAPPVAVRAGLRERPASIELIEVSHEYVPGHPVLTEVSLTVRPGERVALVGPSGAGKSTVAKLVAGVCRPSRGTVTVGGRALDQTGPPTVPGLVALVTQEVHTFAGPLADDLRLARPGATKGELWEAIDAVGARGWVERLDRGLKTLVGEGATRLTPAQAQHLALAGLVLADPAIAVLDEATAEAGSAGAGALEAAVDKALAGRTSLVVAHRLSQAVAADRVVVLEAGRVVEVGPHDALVAAGGRYARLWTAWADPRGARSAAAGTVRAGRTA